MNRFAPLSALFALVLWAVPALAADDYKVDPVHSTVLFRVHHANVGQYWGRFNDPAGTFTLDEADVAKSTFNVEVKVNNVDTHNPQRDGHLKSPDFFNEKQFPTITFKSTAAKKGDAANVLLVTGDLTIHGVTRSVTVPVELTGKGEFPKGTPRAGVEAVFNIKRTEFDMKNMVGPVGDDVRLVVSLEGTK
jgi:polyisoprenoid-binding protein YceI